MAKLFIARNRYGKYYAKVVNNYHKCQKLVSVFLPNGVELPRDYGTYDCEYYLSCYPKGNNVEINIIVTKIYGSQLDVVNPQVNPAGVQSLNPYEEYNNSTPELPF